jgi:hypothetical protein
MFLSEGKLLNESNLALLYAYTLKVEDGVRNITFNKFYFAFPQAPLNSLKSTERQMQFLPGFQPICYHCCPSSESCVCYTSPYKNLVSVPKM